MDNQNPIPTLEQVDTGGSGNAADPQTSTQEQLGADIAELGLTTADTTHDALLALLSQIENLGQGESTQWDYRGSHALGSPMPSDANNYDFYMVPARAGGGVVNKIPVYGFSFLFKYSFAWWVISGRNQWTSSGGPSEITASVDSEASNAQADPANCAFGDPFVDLKTAIEAVGEFQEYPTTINLKAKTANADYELTQGSGRFKNQDITLAGPSSSSQYGVVLSSNTTNFFSRSGGVVTFKNIEFKHEQSSGSNVALIDFGYNGSLNMENCTLNVNRHGFNGSIKNCTSLAMKGCTITNVGGSPGKLLALDFYGPMRLHAAGTTWGVTGTDTPSQYIRGVIKTNNVPINLNTDLTVL